MSEPKDQPSAPPSPPYGIAIRGEMLADIESQINDLFARYQMTAMERYWILGVMRHAILHQVAQLETIAKAHGLTPKDIEYMTKGKK